MTNLRSLFAEYLETLDATRKDEWYCTDRTMAKCIITPLLDWLEKRAEPQATAQEFWNREVGPEPPVWPTDVTSIEQLQKWTAENGFSLRVLPGRFPTESPAERSTRLAEEIWNTPGRMGMSPKPEKQP